VGEAPGESEDKVGRPFVGRSGQYLDSVFHKLGVDLDSDCRRTNVINCFPGEGKKIPQSAVACCSQRLANEIKEFDPLIIIAMGGLAIRETLGNPKIETSPTNVHGTTFWLEDRVVFCSVHPAFILRNEGWDHVFRRDMRTALEVLVKPKQTHSQVSTVGIRDHQGFEALLKRYVEWKGPIAFDFETTRLSPFGATVDDVLRVGFSVTGFPGHSLELDRMSPEDRNKTVDLLREFFSGPLPKVAHNGHFERLWVEQVFGVPLERLMGDTMLDAHIRDARRGHQGLGFQVIRMSGSRYKEEVNTKDLRSVSAEKLTDYNARDAVWTINLHVDQTIQFFPGMANAQQARLLCLEGDRVLARMGIRGVRVDRGRLAEAHNWVTEERTQNELILRAFPLLAAFQDRERRDIDLGSPRDHKILFYDICKFTPQEYTDKGNPVLRKETLEHISNLPEERMTKTQKEGKRFASELVRFRTLRWLDSTYFKGFDKFIGPDEKVHPNMEISFAESYRSSCSDPNLQNVVGRVEGANKIRRAFVPSRDLFLSCDYKSAEVRVIAMYTQDPVLTKFVKEGQDFHRDWASELFLKPKEEVTKHERYLAKNGFVFPLFYGSYWRSISRNLNKRDVFIKRLEADFWDTFSGVRNWQAGALHQYQKQGYVEFFYGFRRGGLLTRRQVFNSPIQGTAFHMLLEGLIAVEEKMRAAGLKSEAVLEVHDSILFDAVEDEVETIKEICEEVLLRNRYDWQTVPMELDWSQGPDWGSMVEV